MLFHEVPGLGGVHGYLMQLVQEVGARNYFLHSIPALLFHALQLALKHRYPCLFLILQVVFPVLEIVEGDFVPLA